MIDLFKLEIKKERNLVDKIKKQIIRKVSKKL